MAKIYYDENGLNALINNNIDMSISEIKNIISISNNFDIPYDFIYKLYLNNFKSSMNNNLNDLSTILTVIRNSANNFENISNKLNDYMGSIENYSIKLRQSAIK